MDQYTHNFKYEVNGSFIRGEIEFDTDDKATIKVEEWSNPLPLVTLQDFCDVIERVKAIYDNESDTINKIVIKKKE